MPNADGSVFAGTLGKASDARLSRHLRVGGLMTAVGTLQGFVVSLLFPGAALRPTGTVTRLVFDPAPAAPLPLPLGSPRGSKTIPARRAMPSSEPQPPSLAVSLPSVEEPKPVELEEEQRREEAFGSETGNPSGDRSGSEDGTPGGSIGGGPGGLPGGAPNGTGLGIVSDYDAPPRIVRQTRPRYPPDAFVQKVQGTVVLEIVIDAAGHVSRTRVVQSIPALDAAAREAANEWLFQPALRRGRPVASIALAPVHFGLY